MSNNKAGTLIETSEVTLEAWAAAHVQDSEGETALMKECNNGNIDRVKLLLNAGAAVDMQNRNGSTALMDACSRGHTEIVKLLLDAGATVNVQAASMRAWANGHAEIVKLLLDAGKTVSVQDSLGDETAMNRACYHGRTDVVKQLLDAGATVDVRNRNGRAALIGACENGHTEIVKLLLDAGATVNVQDGIYTALIGACENGHTEIVKLLLDAWETVDTQDILGDETALILACYHGLTDVVKLLLDAGAAVDMQNRNGSTALILACSRGRTETAKLLLDAGATVNVQDGKDYTALMRACANGHAEIVKLLLNAEAAVDTQDSLGDETALILACYHGRTDVVKLLLGAGATVDVRNRDGRTALIGACDNGHTEIVKLLLDAGATVNVQDGLGDETALILACYHGRTDVVKLLLDAGAAVDMQNRNGSTALMLACSRGRTETAKLLLGACAAVDVQDGKDYTALMRACANGHVEIVKLLLNAGAAVDTQTSRGDTALTKALVFGHTKCVIALLLHPGVFKACYSRSQDRRNFLSILPRLLTSDDEFYTALLTRMGCSDSGYTTIDSTASTTAISIVDIGAASAATTDEELLSLLLMKDANSITVLQHQLIWACGKGHTAAVKLLLATGAAVDVISSIGGILLITVCENGCTEIVKLLLDAGAAVYLQNSEGETALTLACDKGHIQCVIALLRYPGSFKACYSRSGARRKFLSILSQLLSSDEFYTALLLRMGCSKSDSIAIATTADTTASIVDIGAAAATDGELLSLLLTKDTNSTTVLDHLLQRRPSLQGSSSDVLQALSRQVPMNTMRLHLCGPGGAGKSTLRHCMKGDWERVVALQSGAYSDTRTQGVEIDQSTSVVGAGLPGFRQNLKLHIYDHGGQQEFHVTYSNLLCHPMSLFLVVLPITEQPQIDCTGRGFHPRSTSLSVQRDLRHWLGYLSSLMHPTGARVMVVLNIFGSCSDWFLGDIVRDCSKLLKKCEAESPVLRGKFIYPDQQEQVPIVVSCVNKQRWKKSLFPVLHKAYNCLAEQKITIPAICSALLRSVKSMSKLTGEIVARAAALYQAAREQDITLSKMSDGALDALLGYLEQSGEILLMHADADYEYESGKTSAAAAAVSKGNSSKSSGSQRNRIELVVLDPNLFCNRVIGKLITYQHTASHNKMLQGVSSLKQRIKDSDAGVSDEVLDLLPELLCRMRLCSPLPARRRRDANANAVTSSSSSQQHQQQKEEDDEEEQLWLMTFMEHQQFMEEGLVNLERNAESGPKDFWHELRIMRTVAADHQGHCSGRIVSLDEMLGSEASSSNGQLRSWQSFIPGSFARFQMEVANVFWSTTMKQQQRPQQQLYTMEMAPFWMNLRYDGPDNSVAEVFAQMIHSTSETVQTSTAGMALCCRIWMMGSSTAALKQLLQENIRRVSAVPIASLQDKTVLDSATINRGEEYLTIDKVLDQFVGWFLEACRVSETTPGPELHRYCIHPTAEGETHAETLGAVGDGGVVASKRYFPLEATRKALKDDPHNTALAKRLLGTTASIPAPEPASEPASPPQPLSAPQLVSPPLSAPATVSVPEPVSLPLPALEPASVPEPVSPPLPAPVSSPAPAPEPLSPPLPAPKPVSPPLPVPAPINDPRIEEILNILRSQFISDPRIDEILQSVKINQETTIANQEIIKAMNELQRLLIKDGLGVPRLFVLIPAKMHVRKFISNIISPVSYFTKQYRLFFICPVTLKICNTNMEGKVAKGYKLNLPRSWAREYGPAVMFTLKAIRELVGAGANFVGAPNIAAGLVSDITAALNDSALNDFIDEITAASVFNPTATPAPPPAATSSSSSSSLSAATSGALRAATATLAVAAAAVNTSQLDSITQSSYRTLRTLLEQMDPSLRNTGCAWVVSESLGADTAGAWVSPEAVQDFTQRGKQAMQYRC